MLKLKEGFLLRSVAGRTIVVPTREGLNLNVMIALNDTGCLLWKRLENGATKQELIEALMQEYGVEEAVATADVEAFVENLVQNDFLESL